MFYVCFPGNTRNNPQHPSELCQTGSSVVELKTILALIGQVDLRSGKNLVKFFLNCSTSFRDRKWHHDNLLMPFGQQATAAFMLVEPGHLQFLDTMWVEQKWRHDRTYSRIYDKMNMLMFDMMDVAHLGTSREIFARQIESTGGFTRSTRFTHLSSSYSGHRIGCLRLCKFGA